MSEQQPPPGWYPDESAGGLRYWDGTSWTEYTDTNAAAQTEASSPTDAAAPAPGWYPDPTAPGRQRYWDGSSWTDWTDENYGAKAGTPGWPGSAQGGAGAPGGHHAWVATPPRTNGMAVTSMVLGIVAAASCLLFLPLGVILGPIAIVLSVRSKRVIDADPSQTGRGMATAGLVTGIVGILLGLIVLAGWISLINDPYIQGPLFEPIGASTAVGVADGVS